MTENEAKACSILMQKHFPNIEHSIEEHASSGVFYIVILSDYISHNPAAFGDDTGRHKITSTHAPFFIDLLNTFVPRGTINLLLQFKEVLSRLEQSPLVLDGPEELPK